MDYFELEYKPDAAKAYERIEAWWDCAVLDRPAVQVRSPKPGGKPVPEKTHATIRDRWMDAEYVVECADAWMSGRYYAGDVIPAFIPDVGPEYMATGLGAELRFSEDSSWSVPILHDWGGIPKLEMDPDTEYIRKMIELTRRGLDVGRGKFLVGVTDLHPGADLAASLRDPQQLCLDLIEAPEQVHKLMDQIRPCFYQHFELLYDVLHEAGQKLCTSWMPTPFEGRFYPTCADFACMVSADMFQEFFLPEIVEEIDYLDRSIYHLDGPGALQDLDLLLDIPKLRAVQFVYGAGNEPASRWMDVYKRIQAAGKAMHIDVEPNDIEPFMEALRPEGVMLSTWADTPEEADAIVAKVARW
jgi:hypothetical protein